MSSHSTSKPLDIIYKPINTAQEDVKEKWTSSKLLILEGVAGTGKAQPLDSLVMTPYGPKRMGNISIGEEVLTTTGVTTVSGVFPQGVKPVFLLRFNDGTSVRACGEHLWEVNVLGSRYKKILNTEEIRNNLFRSDGRHKYSIDTCQPTQFSSSLFQIVDPYLMGYILAKGAISPCGNVALNIYNQDIVDKINCRIPENWRLKYVSRNYYLLLADDNLSEYLKALNLNDTTIYTRFIPDEYLYSDAKQRVDLLNGLLDGDGGCDRGYCEFYTTSIKLRDDISTLVQSLGGLTFIREKSPSREDYAILYHIRINIDFNPFTTANKYSKFSQRKRQIIRRYIVDVTPAGFENCQCISLVGDNKLYLTDNFTPTHNTSSALAHSLIDLQKEKIRKVMLCRPTIAVEEDLGHLPGDKNEKLLPWMGSFIDVLGDMSHAKGFDYLPVELVPVGMLRGRTVKDAVLIVDEAQNLSYNQLVCIVTRVGKNGKVVLCGDIHQSDLKYTPIPLDIILQKLKDVKGCNVIEFKKEHQVREPFVNDVLDALGG